MAAADMPLFGQIQKKGGLVKEKIQTAAMKLETQTASLVKNPQFQTCTMMTGCGAITIGAAGGAFGIVSGVVLGGAAGVLPSIVTFGLSIPAGALLGGGAGLCTGTVIGGSTGGLAGYSVYKYRVEMKDGVVYVKVKCTDILKRAEATMTVYASTGKTRICSTVPLVRERILATANATQARAKAATSAANAKLNEFVDVAATKTKELGTFATTTRTGVTSTSALAGGAVGGTTGGVFGSVAGAAVGVVPAVFTFGLSIPVCAMVGMCAGTTVGGIVGAVGGGAVGFGGFTYKREMRDTAQSAWEKTSKSVVCLKTKASEKALDMKASAKAFVSSGTGGTEAAVAC